MFSDLNFLVRRASQPLLFIHQIQAGPIGLILSSLPCLAASTQIKEGKVQGTTYLWIRTHFRCLLQPEFPLCYVLPKSASCLLDLLHWCFTLAALADFPGGSPPECLDFKSRCQYHPDYKTSQRHHKKKNSAKQCILGMWMQKSSKIYQETESSNTEKELYIMTKWNLSKGFKFDLILEIQLM